MADVQTLKSESKAWNQNPNCWYAVYVVIKHLGPYLLKTIHLQSIKKTIKKQPDQIDIAAV